MKIETSILPEALTYAQVQAGTVNEWIVRRVRGTRVRLQNSVTAAWSAWLHITGKPETVLTGKTGTGKAVANEFSGDKPHELKSGKGGQSKSLVHNESNTTPEAAQKARTGEGSIQSTESVLDALTVGELRARAKEAGHKGYSKLRKDKLVELLTA